VKIVSLLMCAGVIEDQGLLHISTVLPRAYSPFFPCSHEMAFFCVVDLEPEECGTEHTVELRISDPDLLPVAQSPAVAFTVPRPQDGYPVAHPIAVRALVGFSQPGEYHLMVGLDGQLAHEQRLIASRLPEP
jgi:hypothetical protein